MPTRPQAGGGHRGADSFPTGRACLTPGWGVVTGGEAPLPCRPHPPGPRLGGHRGAPRRPRPTFVAPVDAGDLDLLRGDVLLHELLALQAVPQRRLARVPVPADHDRHWERAQVRQSEQGKLAPPQASTHTCRTRTPACPRAGNPGQRQRALAGERAALLRPRPPGQLTDTL